MTDEEIVKTYLIKKSQRMLKKIDFGGKLNFQVFILTIALIAVLPLIQESENFDLKTVIPFLRFKYEFLITIYFLNLLGLITFNVVLGIVNVSRKKRYKKVVKEIRNLE